MKNTIAFYIAVFMRRIHYFIIIFGVLAAISVTVARLLPAVYVSSSRLLIESSQIPTSLAESTVQTGASEELQIIEQRLMTRVNLLDVARSQKVFEDIGTMAADDIVDEMRRATSINISAGAGQATLMSISFEADTGQIAANVVNQFVTKVLQDNAENRADRAGDTLEFFEVEVERLGAELERQNAKILAFNNENSDALPETLNYRLSQQTSLQATLNQTEREITLVTEQRRRLVDIFNATGSVGPTPTANLSPEEQKLLQLQDALRNAKAVFSEEHPKVVTLERQVKQQEELVSSRSGVASDGQVTPSSILDIQLADMDARIDVLNKQKLQTQEQLGVLNESIERTPEVTIKLASLNRDYKNISDQYNNATRSLAVASTGERIELLSKGRRIAVIDPATVPSEPARPNRTLIAAGGSLFGAFLGLAVIAALEFLNSSIRRSSDITRKLGITPLATVPYVRTPMEMVIRRAVFVALFAILVIGIPAILFAVHTYYLPLDLIYARISDKVSGML
ncbi:MAG: GumC family protein [Marinosulfonomonas sp.]